MCIRSLVLTTGFSRILMLANHWCSDQTVHECRMCNPDGMLSRAVDNYLSTPSAVSSLYLLS